MKKFFTFLVLAGAWVGWLTTPALANAGRASFEKNAGTFAFASDVDLFPWGTEFHSLLMPCPGSVQVNLGSGECGRVVDQFGFSFPNIDVQNVSVIPNDDPDACLATVYCPSGQTTYRRTFHHAGPTDMRVASVYVGVFEAYNNPLVTFNFYTLGGDVIGSHSTVVPHMNASVLFVPLPLESNIRIPAGTSYIMEVVANAPYVSVFKIGRNDQGQNPGYSEAVVSALDCPSGGFIEEGPVGYNANSIVFGLRAIPDDYKYINVSNGYQEGDFFPIGTHAMDYQVVDAAGNSTACSFTIQIVEFPAISGALACNDQVNISLDDDCNTLVTPGMVLEGDQYGCFDNYSVQLFAPNGASLGNTITSAHMGMTLKYQVFGPNGNSCWGDILVEDKLPPQFECQDIYATCTSDLTPGSLISPRVPVAAYIADGTIDEEATSSNTYTVDVAHLMGSTIQDLNVYIDATHSRVSDLSATITSPDGVTVPLFFGLNCTGQNMMVTLDDAAASTNADLQNICDPADVSIAGTFRPFQNLSIFNGKPLEGSWNVTIYDNNPGAGGQVNQVHLVFIQQGAYVPFPIAGPVTHSHVNNNTYVVYGADNCGPATLTYTDEVIEEDCASVYSRIIKRCWKGLDPKGNIAEPCCQYIYVYRNSLATLEFPLNFDGLPGHENVLSCADFGDKIPGTDVTGSPTGDLCENVQILPPVDAKIDICSHSYKILRTHKVVEWCSGQVITHNQIIKVIDNEGPTLTCPQNVTISTDDFDCTATYTVPLPVVKNECSDLLDYHLSYNYLNNNDDEYSDVNADQAGRTITGLVKGANWIRWQVTDECGNSSECRFQVTVEDKILPNAVCDKLTIASLTGNGRAKIDAFTFDDGSTDNCGIFSYEARKMTDICQLGSSEFSSSVEFCCEEVNTKIQVELRVTDIHGNSNTCMVEVYVQDKLPPYITKCPADITINCKADYTDLSLTGEPDYIDNCKVVEVKHSDDVNISQCGVGIVNRTWTVKDAQGYTHSCLQRITLFDNDPFYVNKQDPSDPDDDIVWPLHYETQECHATLDPASLPAGYNRPVVVSDPCSMIAMQYEDQVFKFVDGACEKIIRTWTVIDWCTYDDNNPNSGNGIYQYTQIIKMQNKQAPVFLDGCQDRNFQTFGDCKGLVEYSPEVEDDCTTDSADFLWKYELYNQSGAQLLLSGNTAVFSKELDNGVYLIKWTLEDRCGNRAYCTHNITVDDGKKPSPYCLSSLATAVMNSNGTIEIWAKDFDRGAYDNCTPSSQLLFTFSGALPVVSLKNQIHYFKGKGELATQAEYEAGEAQKWIPSTHSSGLLFSCKDIPNGISQEITVEVTVTDLSGNQDYCTVQLLLQDNTNYCPDNTSTYSISGKTLFGTLPVVGAEAILTSTIPEQNKTIKTDANGNYQFSGLPGLNRYSLRVTDNRGFLNGVSTLDLVMIQRHILGLDAFSDPKKIIAADIDNNGKVTASDLTALRKGILGIATEFPNGQQSWRFVATEYKFPDPNQPFPFSEKYEYVSLNENKVNQNFQAVKIGDVNQSATVNPDDVLTEIRSQQAFTLIAQPISGEAGEEIRVPVSSADATEIVGYQFTMEFDPSLFELKRIEGGKVAGEENFGLHRSAEGLVTTSWNAEKPVELNSGDELFTLVFTLKKQIADVSAITVSSALTSAAAYNSEYEGTPVVLQSRELQGKAEFALLQNQPNPFTDQTLILFTVAASADVIFTFTDVTGKIINEIEGHYEKGTHTLELDLSDNKTTGIVLCTMKSGQFVSSRKMIRIE
jgi:subtilisin-like proprotein convertase family protein